MLNFVLCSTRALARNARHSNALTCTPVLARPSERALFGKALGRRRTRSALARPTRMVIEEPVVEEEIDPGKVEGTDLQVLRYPHPLLRAPNATVQPDEFNDELKQIAKEMLLVMYASRGVGLAAPQVGINKRLMVFNPEGDSQAFLKEVVMVNPEIVGKSKKTLVEPEACLSFPGMNGNVRRHEWVKIEATRLNGKKFKVRFEGWVARIFQHEFDHLQGILYPDKLETDEDRANVKERLAELVEEYRRAPYEGQAAAL